MNVRASHFVMQNGITYTAAERGVMRERSDINSI